MRKLLFAGACLFIASAVQAQTYDYSYSQDRVDQGYNVPHPAYSQNGYAAQNNYDYSYAPAPTSVQAYGFYQQPAPAAAPVPYRQQQMTWYPTQQQRAAANGQAYAYPAYYMQEDVQEPEYVSRSPVYNSKAVRQKRPYYMDMRLGVGGTAGWTHDFDTPIGPIWGIAVGTRLSPTVRVDAEFDYHAEEKLASVNNQKIQYKQYDLGGSVYYDFPVNFGMGVQPFVGAGLWAVKGKASGKYRGKKIADADSSFKLGVSVAGGVVYPINEMFSAFAMARARYIDTDSDLYNIEGFVGMRYHF